MIAFLLRWSSNWLAELDAVSPQVARRLVAPLYCEGRTLVVSAWTFVLLSAICYAATGSHWYLAGGAAAVATSLWRIQQARSYMRDADSIRPREWARRAIAPGWLAAAVWGAWGTAITFEPDKAVVVMIIGVHAAFVIGGAVRNNSVPIVPKGQVLLAQIPAALVALGSDRLVLQLYAGFMLLHVASAMALIRVLHAHTKHLLLADEHNATLMVEKTDLLEGLEAANQELEVANQHLQMMVGTDALTQIPNRRSLDLALTREWRRGLREQNPLCVLMLDVDHFKTFNDFYGHVAGDNCLREVAATIQGALSRPTDFVARYGGEEFGVLMPNTWPEGASHVADAIIAALAAREIVHERSPLGRVSVSIGVACMVPHPGASATELVATADAALYAAKAGGRNRAHVGEDADADADVPASAV